MSWIRNTVYNVRIRICTNDAAIGDQGIGRTKKGGKRRRLPQGKRVRKEDGQLMLLSPVDDDALHAGDEPRIQTPHDPVSLNICLI